MVDLNNKFSAMRRLSIYAMTALFLIALSGFGEDADADQPSLAATEQLRQVIVAHYRAIADNQLNQAMRYYHNQSPEKGRAREDIELGLSQFLRKTTTINFCFDGRKGEFALVTARHKILRISGIKFSVQYADVVYQLREEQGNWKIWTQRDNSGGIVRLTNCNRAGIQI